MGEVKKVVAVTLASSVMLVMMFGWIAVEMWAQSRTALAVIPGLIAAHRFVLFISLVREFVRYRRRLPAALLVLAVLMLGCEESDQLRLRGDVGRGLFRACENGPPALRARCGLVASGVEQHRLAYLVSKLEKRIAALEPEPKPERWAFAPAPGPSNSDCKVWTCTFDAGQANCVCAGANPDPIPYKPPELNFELPSVDFMPGDSGCTPIEYDGNGSQRFECAAEYWESPK